jgi:TatD DNase family protein
MIDSHCHLTDPRLLEQFQAVLDRARDAGVERIVTIGVDLDDDAAAIALCRNRANLRCAIGVHPNHAHEIDLNNLPKLRELQADPAVVALGEMGLDYFHQFADRNRQREVFVYQLDLAQEFGRPVVIHSRDAIPDTLSILRDFPSVRAVFHCFTGSLSEARAILDAGYFIGFTGAVTFKKADALREVARLAPDDRFLIETDAPYLSPEPMRKQKTNEPSLVKYVAKCLARVRGCDLATIDRLSSANALALYQWED